MSVFTPLNAEQLADFVQRYELGALLDFSGISGGSENSNFFVNLQGGQFVLTLIERGATAPLPLIIELLAHLHQQWLSVPYAVTDAMAKLFKPYAASPLFCSRVYRASILSIPPLSIAPRLGNGWLVCIN